MRWCVVGTGSMVWCGIHCVITLLSRSTKIGYYSEKTNKLLLLVSRPVRDAVVTASEPLAPLVAEVAEVVVEVLEDMDTLASLFTTWIVEQ